jgi:Tfp pilus assembly protein PilO
MTVQPRDRALLGIVGVIALVAAFYVLLLKPEHRTANHIATEIGTAQATLASAQQQEARGHAAEVSLRQSSGDWTQAQRAVPRVSDIPGLLRLLQKSATDAHVGMQSITLSAAGGSATATPTIDHGATTIPVALTFDGGYQALNRLVQHLDALVTVSHGHLHSHGPLVGISQVSLGPSQSTSDPSQLTVQLTATIYQHSASSTVLGSSVGGS